MNRTRSPLQFPALWISSAEPSLHPFTLTPSSQALFSTVPFLPPRLLRFPLPPARLACEPSIFPTFKPVMESRQLSISFNPRTQPFPHNPSSRNSPPASFLPAPSSIFQLSKIVTHLNQLEDRGIGSEFLQVSLQDELCLREAAPRQA